MLKNLIELVCEIDKLLTNHSSTLITILSFVIVIFALYVVCLALRR